MALAELTEICLEITGDPLEVRLYKIDRSGDQSRAILVKDAPLVPAAPLDHGGSLGAYDRDDAKLVTSGRTLLGMLSPGEVGSEWQTLREQYRGDLCTYLCVQPSDLAKLPWELLTDGLLPFAVAGPIIQTPNCLPPSDYFKPVWPVRVFVINASDPDDTGIKAEQEIWNIRQALRKAEHSFDLEVYDVAAADATFNPGMLVDAIKQRWPTGPHIIHFIGHSVAEPKPALQYYVSAAQEYRDWSLAMIANAMNQLPDLRLVYVNACRSQQGGPDPAAPWSVASALLKSAVAVIAMQSDISGEAAVACARGFYDALAGGQPVGRALVTARQALLDRFSETSRELYAPVLTTRVAARDILPMRSFGWDQEKHTAWQNLLKENWTYFVNQHPHRRRLCNALFEPAPGRTGLIVLGDNSVGKSWLVKWFTYAIALNGLQTHYLAADQSADWLELLRRLRDGCATLNCPGLDLEIRNEFNWKLNHLAQGQAPPAYVPGQVVEDTAGLHADIMQRRPIVNGFDAAVCEAMVHALRQQVRRAPLVLVLDNPSLPMVATLKVPFLDALAGRTAMDGVRVILCCHNKLWESYQTHYLDFTAWTQISLSEIEQRQVGGLLRELIRLQCPDCEETKAQRIANLERNLKNLPTRAMKAADLYNTSSVLYRTFVDV
jgi:hypothetical protein